MFTHIIILRKSKKNRINYRIIIAGKCDNFNEYRKYIGIESKIDVVNKFIIAENVPKYFNEASIVVLPYISATQTGIIPLAYSFGKPVIGSRIGGIPEQVEDNKNGLLFEMGNVEQLARKMEVLAEDKELRKEMGRAAREKLEREYSLKHHCEGLLDIYSELLGRDVRKDVSERVQ